MTFPTLSIAGSSRLVGAAGAVALAAGTLGVMAPTDAATGTLTYTCAVPGLGDQPFTMVADTDAPKKIAYGETVAPTTTGTVTVPENVTTFVRDANGAKKVDGKADVASTVDGSASPWALTVPRTNVPPNGGMALVGKGPTGTFEGKKVGSVYDIAVGNFTATMNFYEANDTPSVPPSAQIPCTLNPGQHAAVDTIAVVKDATTTGATAPDISKGAKAQARVLVGSEHGTTPKGKIKAKLVRNGKIWQTKILTLREGARTVTFQRIRVKGNFKVRVKYVGRESWKGSRAVDTLVVG